MDAASKMERTCPSCGGQLPANSRLAACEKCLLLGVTEPGTLEVGVTSSHDWDPPPTEELQRLLPGYGIIEFLGRGGMGAVYKGRQMSLDRLVAIKVLPAALHRSEHNFSERFKLEARAMARLSHPGIVPVHDFGETADGLLYFVMEFMEGRDVARIIAQEGCVRSADAHAIACQVCDALHFAHEKGVIHRDIKPSNIMVARDGQSKVADFGLAKMHAAAGTELTKGDVVMGTPHYLAPEALVHDVEVDRRADVYALGVMLYQMLTGRLPQGVFEMPSRIVPGLDVRFDQIVAKAMRADPEQRYQTAREMRADLDAMLTSPLAREEGEGNRQTRWQAASISDPSSKARARQKRKRSWLLPASVAAGLLVAAGFVRQNSGQQLPKRDPSPPNGGAMDANQMLAALRLLSVGVRLGMEDEPGGEVRLVTSAAELDRKPGALVELSMLGDQKVEDQDLAGIGHFPRLAEVDGYGTKLTGSFLAGMKPEQPLRYLVLGQGRGSQAGGCTDEALRFAARMKSLEQLSVPFSSVSDAGLAHLHGHPRLHALELHGLKRVTDASVDVLLSMPALANVGLGHSGVTSQGLRRLAALPALQTFAMGGSGQTEACLGAFKAAKSLREMHFYDMTFSSAGVKALGDLPEVATVGFWSCAFAPGAFKEGAPWRKLTRLRVGDTTDDLLAGLFAAVAGQGTVTEILLRSPNAKPGHLAPLADCSSLRTLELDMHHFDDTCVPVLSRFRFLTTLLAGGTRLSPGGVAELRKALPQCRITGPAGTNPAPAPAIAERLAAEWALDAGAQVWIKGRSLPLKSKLEIPSPDALEVVRIELPNLDNLTAPRAIKGAELKVLRGLRGLQTFVGRSHPLGEEGVEHLATLKSLTLLDLHACAVPRTALRHLSGLGNLQHLDLGWAHHPARDPAAAMNDASILELAGLKKLRWMNLYKSALTDRAFAVLLQLPQLEYVEISAIPAMTSEGIRAFESARPQCRVVRGN